MIQHIRRVEPDLYRFSFGDSECLAEICIEPDYTRQLKYCLSEITLRSGFRILKHDLSELSIAEIHGTRRSGRDDSCNCVETAVQSRWKPLGLVALRIAYNDKWIPGAEEVSL